MKNYIAFVNDHSGSMGHLAKAAMNDYNANILATKDAASREMLDTVVSVIALGLRDTKRRVDYTRQVMISNPHVLRPISSWPTPGGTPLYDSVGDAIELHESLPDYDSPDVSFLIITTTDGDELSSSKYTEATLAKKIKALQATGRWTFVFRVPRGSRSSLRGLGVPDGNIQEWDTTTAGLAKSNAVTTAAMDGYFRARSAGAKSSGTFYADASNVSAAVVQATLVDISAEVSPWTVLSTEDGMEIKPFAEKRLGNMPFLKGAAFYQLSKTERKIAASKLILIRDKATGHLYEGAAARQLIGLPVNGDARVKPGADSNYDIFVQSTSINRKLVAGTTVMYWPKVGTGFSAADFPWLQNVQANANPALHAAAAQAIKATAGIAPATPVAAKPAAKKASKKKVAAAPAVASVVFYPNRAAARATGKKVYDAGPVMPAGKRWYTKD